MQLSYDSGAGNGPFGLGWSMGVATISRKTAKGLPRYADADESDVFVLLGAEELVPLLVQGAQGWQPDESPDPTKAFTVRRYRPRVESEFARVERWTEDAKTGDVHWRVISRDNVTTTYGRDPNVRIVDPEDDRRIFSWLVDSSFDAVGNLTAYEYKAEDAVNVPSTAFEARRTHTANRYVKRIRYGADEPYRPWADPALPKTWRFEVVFDYGEHDAAAPTPDEDVTWPARADRFRPTDRVSRSGRTGSAAGC